MRIKELAPIILPIFAILTATTLVTWSRRFLTRWSVRNVTVLPIRPMDAKHRPTFHFARQAVCAKSGTRAKSRSNSSSSGAGSMTTTCLINNYNYAHFISQAIDSASSKRCRSTRSSSSMTGQTDATLDLLASRYARASDDPSRRQAQSGAIVVLQRGLCTAKGDIVFFLDADDVYEPNYLEQALDVYRRDSQADFVFCGYRQFGQRDSLQLDFATDQDLGYSVILVACLRNWIGGPTSCLSMRRAVLEKILPLPFLDAWRTRADDCLVFGSSLAGAKILSRPAAGALSRPRHELVLRPRGGKTGRVSPPPGNQRFVRAHGA